ncbi:hypothetical protein ACXM0N_16680 [Peribacillus simplex]
MRLVGEAMTLLRNMGTDILMKEKNYPVVGLKNVAKEERQGKVRSEIIDRSEPFSIGILEELDQFIGFLKEAVDSFKCSAIKNVFKV